MSAERIAVIGVGGNGTRHIEEIQASASSATRGFPVEDTAAMVFRFVKGALGTFMLSDAAASPGSWEQTSQENPAYVASPTRTLFTSLARAGLSPFRPCG